MVTIADVAELAKVSTATVSRVIHNKGYVRDETRKAVLEAIKKLDYRENLNAQSLRSQKSSIIGHVLRNSFVNPFFANVAYGVDTAAAAAGHVVLTATVEGPESEERKAVDTLLRRRVDGVIFTTISSEENALACIRNGVAVVMNERYFDIPFVDRVTADNRSGATEAVRQLVALGHRRIAFIGGLISGPAVLSRTEEDRFAGYLDALKEGGIPFRDSFVKRCEYGVENGREAAISLLSGGTSISAIFAASDQIALGAYQAIIESGMSIPEDVSLVGFDDTLAKYGAKPLTTVRMPMYDIGRTAVQLLIERQSGVYEGEARTVEFKTRLVVGKTTGSCRQSSS